MSPQRPELPPPAVDAGALHSDPAFAVKAFIRARREWFERASAERMDAMAVNAASSDAVDAAVRLLFERAASVPPAGECAVLALGGYGRREMGPLSDIDLLFLVGPNATAQEQAVTDGILYPFWDSGIEVGGATRTIADCRSVIAHDARALTALIEARLICGSEALHGQLGAMLRAHFSAPAERRRYALAKIEERRERLSRFGDSLYLLQPELKEGEGGLRDYHTLRWVCFAARPQAGADAAYLHYLTGDAERASLQRSLRFLWSVRHLLNLKSGSRSDRLLEALQGDLAAKMGFCAEGKATAAERFMSEYYRHAEALHLLCEQGIEAARRELVSASRAARWLRRRNLGGGILRTEHGTIALKATHEPTGRQVAELFLASRRTGLPVDALSKRRIAERLAAGAGDAALLQGAGHWLPALLSGLPHLDRALRDLRDSGVLTRAFPEMEAAFHHVQHDGFHYYTAGVHSIRAVGELSLLAAGKTREEVPKLALKRIRRRHVLALAALLHDVGKGQGGDHEEKGALLARAAAQRIGFSPEDAADAEFLVRSHLLMSVLAFRRDVSDPGLIERFSHSFRTPELLAMLYLLTWADLRTIGPHIWSDWKGGLLAGLYRSTHGRMTEGGAVSHERQRREQERLTREVARLMGRDCSAERVREFLQRLPLRYGHAVEPEAVAAHLLMTGELASHPLATFVRPAPDRGCTEFSVVTADAPGLFAKIAGVLSAGGANIVDAQVYTSTDGLAIDVIWITDSTHRPFEDPEALARIRAELLRAITGGEELHAIVGGRFKRRLLQQVGRQRPPQVFIDNDVSATHTVVEVHADDRRGLLYAIAAVFHELACTIDLARITTSVDRVIDVFYIRDAQGGKIDSRERIRAVSERLLEALE